MWLIDQIAEQKISEAVANGELDDLPGAGRPIMLDDDSLVPEEVRTAYRLLKNAGYLPPDVELRKQISNVESLLVQARSDEQRGALNRRLNYLLMRLHISGARSPLINEAFYSGKLHPIS